jgi:hypothetical protein
MGVRAYLEIYKNGRWEYDSAFYHQLISRPSNLTAGCDSHTILVRGLPNDVSEQVTHFANGDAKDFERFNEPTWATKLGLCFG